MTERDAIQCDVDVIALNAALTLPELVHAAIERALWQLLSEISGLMQRTLALSGDELIRGPGVRRIRALNDYRTEISAQLVQPMTKGAHGHDLADDLAQTARELAVETPTIEAALDLNEPVARQRRRVLALTLSRQPVRRLEEDPESVLNELHEAFDAAMIITYAEGLALLSAAVALNPISFQPAQITRLWKVCSPLRSTLLEDIASALEATPNLPNLLCDDDLSEKLMEHQEYLRRAVWRAHQLDFLTPVMLAALHYLDSRREAWWPVNLIQVSPRRRPPISQPA